MVNKGVIVGTSLFFILVAILLQPSTTPPEVDQKPLNLQFSHLGMHTFLIDDMERTYKSLFRLTETDRGVLALPPPPSVTRHVPRALWNVLQKLFFAVVRSFSCFCFL